MNASCSRNLRSPEDYATAYSFEREFNYIQVNKTMTDQFPYIIATAALYVVVIHAGQWYMQNRKPFQLRGLLLMWNVDMALFSLVVLVRVMVEMSFLVSNFGVHFTICDFGTYDHQNMIGFWTRAFTYSKLVELGDTAFIVLRKTPLIFLHWYHHLTVLLYVWYSCVVLSSIGRWFMAVNLFVHTIMYSYYALKVLRVKVPKKVSMAITSVQLLQMVAGMFLTGYSLRMRLIGESCCVDYRTILLAWTMYLSYFILFLNFFIKAYFSNKKLREKLQYQKKLE